MKNSKLPRIRELRKYSTELRNHATRQENRLWYDFLSGYPIHFYRQRIIGPYIADFYCPKARLVVELDGCQHRTEAAAAYDMRRSAYMAKYSIRVIRFRNRDVTEHFSAVCSRIDTVVQERIESLQNV